MLYNPITRTPYALVENIRDVTDDERMIRFHLAKAKASLDEAIAQDYVGHIYWTEYGRVYRGHLTPAWSWTPVTDPEGVEVPGINWGTRYFQTREQAFTFRERIIKEFCSQADMPRYHEEGDTWSVHYHYELCGW